jgi:hypothetical protein
LKEWKKLLFLFIIEMGCHMKTRIAIAGALTILIFILLPLGLIFTGVQNQGLFLTLAIVLLVYNGLYIFGGLAKLIVYFIYGLFIALALIYAPRDYQMSMILLGTLLVVLNPLANFENFLEDKLQDEAVQPIRFSIRGSYWPFFSYRREMKNFYHLPQAQKLYTHKTYLVLRQLTTIGLFTLGIFLFIQELNTILNVINRLNFDNIFVFYMVVIVFLLAYFSFKKGFTSTFRTLTIALFPVILYLTLRSDLPPFYKYGLTIAFLLLGIVLTVYEIKKYFQRVAYDSYHYYDIDRQEEVFANALFEPLVYNETFTLAANYKIKIKLETFHKSFEKILIYANYFKFMITAYTYGKENVYVYADFHFKKRHRADQFKSYLESIFKLAIPHEVVSDPHKNLYETRFFHRPGYIIARALNLANLLKQLDIDSNIYLSFIVYFESNEDLDQFNAIYPLTVIEEMSNDEYSTVRVDIESLNIEYIIESRIRDILLDLLVYHGKFVRINVFY